MLAEMDGFFLARQGRRRRADRLLAGGVVSTPGRPVLAAPLSRVVRDRVLDRRRGPGGGGPPIEPSLRGARSEAPRRGPDSCGLPQLESGFWLARAILPTLRPAPWESNRHGRPSLPQSDDDEAAMSDPSMTFLDSDDPAHALDPDAPPDLIIDDDDRYSRLRLIPWWRQEKLAAAKVLVVGAGALGNEVLKNLALLGVGTTYVIDLDNVEPSNLSRSVLFRAEDGGQPKAEVAVEAGDGDQPRGRYPWHSGRRDHRPRPGPVRRCGRGDRLPRQPRGAAVGQSPVLEGRNALGRFGHPGNSRRRQGLRAARFVVLRMHHDEPRLSAPEPAL